MSDAMKNGLKLGIVGGCGSSGTTLLAHLLSKHPHVGSGPEFNIFNHHELYDFDYVKKNWRKMLDGKCAPSGYIDVGVFMTHLKYYGLSTNKIEAMVTSADTLEEFVAQLCIHMHGHFQAPYFLEKSPTNVYGFSNLARLFPDVPLVHVVRDGRDVVCSLMKRGFNLYGAGSRWLYDTLCGLSIRSAPNYHEVRYETLVNNPEETLEKLYAHLGVDALDQNESNDLADKSVYTEDWQARDVPKVWTQTPADPVSTASVGKHLKVLDRKQIQALNEICVRDRYLQDSIPEVHSFGDLLAYLGYEDDPGGADCNADSIGRMEKWKLQLIDYNRRFSRITNYHGFTLPKVYTYIR